MAYNQKFFDPNYQTGLTQAQHLFDLAKPLTLATGFATGDSTAKITNDGCGKAYFIGSVKVTASTPAANALIASIPVGFPPVLGGVTVYIPATRVSSGVYSQATLKITTSGVYLMGTPNTNDIVYLEGSSYFVG